MNTKKPLTVNWRTTYMGGLTIPVAFKYGPPLTYVTPIEKTESRTGTHGRYVYDDVDIVLLLEQSNVTSHRYATIYYCRNDLKDLCMKLKELVETTWQTTGSPKLTLYKILETYGDQTSR
jgi:hypothetical protein